MRIKCVVIKALASDFEQLQGLTSVSFCSHGTLMAHAIVRWLQRLSKSDKCSNQNALLLSGGSRYLRRRMKSNKPCNVTGQLIWFRLLKLTHFRHFRVVVAQQ